jgi:hypothetical protein
MRETHGPGPIGPGPHRRSRASGGYYAQAQRGVVCVPRGTGPGLCRIVDKIRRVLPRSVNMGSWPGSVNRAAGLKRLDLPAPTPRDDPCNTIRKFIKGLN